MTRYVIVIGIIFAAIILAYLTYDQIENGFESTKYREVFGPGSPIVHLETRKPMLDHKNCHRYAYWLTEHQHTEINQYDKNTRYPPWGNQIFPLVDYCVSSGDLIKIIQEDKIQWEFKAKD